MIHINHGRDQEQGANSDGQPYDNAESQEGRGRGRSKLSTALKIPGDQNTGNLRSAWKDDSGEQISPSNVRLSLDATLSATDYGPSTRSPMVNEHEHGLGPSGLGRIRQCKPMRAPTLPEAAISSGKAPSSTPRSSSGTMSSGRHNSPASSSMTPTFSEDLSRFPSESLHSFSFAHQSEDLMHNRQNVLKRSMEFMKDRMGWIASSNAALASAQARVTGDVETQKMLHLLAKAQVVGAGNLPSADTVSSFVAGPLTGPAGVNGEDVFEKNFMHRTSSPVQCESVALSPKTRKSDCVPLGTIGTTTRAKQSEPSPAAHEAVRGQPKSESSSRTPTNESASTANTSPPDSRKPTLRRTYTDTESASLQQKLMDTMAQPFLATGSPTLALPDVLVSPTMPDRASFSVASPIMGSTVHGHGSRWVPAAQAIFTTEAKAPYTIIAANDLACLVFGVTKAEVRRMGILEVVQQERRSWLEDKLLIREGGDKAATRPGQTVQHSSSQRNSSGSALVAGRGGITAQLLSKPSSRTPAGNVAERRAQTVHNSDPSVPRAQNAHHNGKSRGVLLCGDVVPIRKRNGATGAASLWVKEKKVGLIWVLEEIHEDVAWLSLDEEGTILSITGDTGSIWGHGQIMPGMDIGKLVTRIPRQGIDPRYGAIDYAQIAKRKYFTCRNKAQVNIPVTITQTPGKPELRISSFPHIAGIVVVEPDSLKVKSSNSVFCGALFGYEKSQGLPINKLVPGFDKLLKILMDQEGVELQEGLVIPDQSFRKASALLAVRDGRPDAASLFLKPEVLPACHRDGTELKIDIQMRVVKSEKRSRHGSSSSDDEPMIVEEAVDSPEMLFALWITYTRHAHAPRSAGEAAHGPVLPLRSGTATPLHQPSPGQTPARTPPEMNSESDDTTISLSAPTLAKQLKEVAKNAAAKLTGSTKSTKAEASTRALAPKIDDGPPAKKTITDFVILEEMGQGAYGQVKLARYKHDGRRKVVLKYVTKRRILVDTWTRDRRLGTVPLEIHVLDYLRRDGLKHPNIVEMEDFFEDDVNYYIEMAPHGLPGMDLFDYIELRAKMDEQECRSIFVQVAEAINHLHTTAKVVHRDIKDENVILDGEGNIRLIDFGSAAYIKSGPFDVFVGTIDYAAPEVLAGRSYGGKEQDVWALGILLYTIVYKENPFYSIDEIMDRDLRVPYTISDESIDLIRGMLNRDVSKRLTISEVLNHAWCRAKDPPA